MSGKMKDGGEQMSHPPAQDLREQAANKHVQPLPAAPSPAATIQRQVGNTRAPDAILRQKSRRALAAITAPLAEIAEPVTRLRSGGARANVGGVRVTILPDRKRRRGEQGGTKTSAELHWSIPGARYQNGQVVRVSGQPAVTMTIRTTYAHGENAQSLSDYGRGTTPQDVRTGNTSLGFHEGRHAMDFLQHLRDKPPPQFQGQTGMSEAEFERAQQDYDQAMQQYRAEMERDSFIQTDCVGKPREDCP